MKKKIFLLFPLLFFFPSSALSQRPLLFAEEPTTMGMGALDFGLGFEYLKKRHADPSDAPIYLVKLPVTRAHLGIGEIAELHFDWRGRLIGSLEKGSNVSDWGDLTVATKIRIFKESEPFPAVGIKYAVKLPNTRYDNKLGSNQTDFFASLLFSKTFGGINARLNAGFGILDDPQQLNNQLDIYTLGAAFIVPAGESAKIFFEWTGFMGAHREQAKLIGRVAIEAKAFDIKWDILGSYHLIGDVRDFGTSFEWSETWSVGLFVHKDFQLW